MLKKFDYNIFFFNIHIMRQEGNQFISTRVCNQNSYDDFFTAYQKNISNILNKLRKSRKKQQYFKRVNRDLSEDNIYLREEINRLEDEDDRVRDLLSEKTKRLRYLEENQSKNTYIIKYRLKYSDSCGREIISDYYDSEFEALNNIDNQKLFVIEKCYQSKSWADYASDSEEEEE